MNPIIANERNKKKCQKFTPLNKVDDMLDLAGYSRDLFGKKVLEYSFGSGNIIKQIVKRYVEDALTQNIDVNNISSGLSADIYGIELDPQLYDQCISDLNEIVRSYGISTVNWSFVCTDALQWTPDIKFDFIIGNPPYISYHDIDETNRKFIRQNFRTCKKGKFDYCYAFLEKGVDLLASGGKMVQLIPSNIYKNVFADDIRKKLLPGISTVWEYPNSQLFEDLDFVCTDQEGKLIRPNFVTEHFDWLLTKYGLKHIRFHDLRHSCASLMVMNGVSMKQVQEWLGHSTFSTTADIYAHLDYKSKQGSAGVIANLLGESKLPK